MSGWRKFWGFEIDVPNFGPVFSEDFDPDSDDDYGYEPEPRFPPLNFIWKTREGLEIVIWKMENDHLRNAIAFLERQDKQNVFLNYERARRRAMEFSEELATTKRKKKNAKRNTKKSKTGNRKRAKRVSRAGGRNASLPNIPSRRHRKTRS